MPKIAWLMSASCFCFGIALGVLLAGLLPRTALLALDVLVALAAVFIIIKSFKIYRSNASNKSHF